MDAGMAQAKAWRDAWELSHWLGTSCPAGWPVCTWKGTRYRFGPYAEKGRLHIDRPGEPTILTTKNGSKNDDVNSSVASDADCAESPLPAGITVLPRPIHVVSAGAPSLLMYWLMDTGCGYDLVQKSHVQHLARHVWPSSYAVTLNTASRPHAVEEEIALRVPQLSEDIEALVLPSAPDVLSIGKRVMEYGYDFIWRHTDNDNPTLVTPDGKVLKLSVHGNIPYLEQTSPATPVTTSSDGVDDAAFADSRENAETCFVCQEEPTAGPATEGGSSSSLSGAVPPPPAPVLADADDNNHEVSDHRRGRRKRNMDAPFSLSHLMTHMPKHRLCPTCMNVKVTQKPAYRRPPQEDADLPAAFGDHLAADHVIAYNDLSSSAAGDAVALMIADFGAGCCCFRAQKTKGGKETACKLREFIGPKHTASYIYIDGSKELAEACDLLSVAHGTSTPGRPESNARAERRVRPILEGTRAALEHSGVPRKFWPYAADHFCHALNTEVIDYVSPWNNRFGRGHWTGPNIPFGALVDFRPSPTTHDRLRDKWHAKTDSGIGFGYDIQPGGKWSGDLLCAELSDFKNCNFRTGRTFEGKRCVRVQRIPSENVVFDGAKPVEFPLKPQADRAFRTLGGLQAGQMDDDDRLAWDGHVWSTRWLGAYDAPGVMQVDPEGNPIEALFASDSDGNAGADEAHSSRGKRNMGGDPVDPAIIDPKLSGLHLWVREDLAVRSYSMSNAIGPPLAVVRYRTVIDTDTNTCLERLQPVKGLSPERLYLRLKRPHNLRSALYYDPSDASMEAVHEAAEVQYAGDEADEPDEEVEPPAPEPAADPAQPPLDDVVPPLPGPPIEEDDGYDINMDGKCIRRRTVSTRCLWYGSDGWGRLGRLSKYHVWEDYCKEHPSARGVGNHKHFLEKCEKKWWYFNPYTRRGQSKPLPKAALAMQSPPRGARAAARQLIKAMGVSYESVDEAIFANHQRIPPCPRPASPVLDSWLGKYRPIVQVCVARPITKWERERNKKATAACDAEWARLRAIKTWDEDAVEEFSVVRDRANAQGVTYHFGRIFLICVEKNRELPDGDARKKFKGRVVFGGDDVWDQNLAVAMFQELSTSPATIEATKTADLHGLCGNNMCEQADAVQAPPRLSSRVLPCTCACRTKLGHKSGKTQT